MDVEKTIRWPIKYDKVQHKWQERVLDVRQSRPSTNADQTGPLQ